MYTKKLLVLAVGLIFMVGIVFFTNTKEPNMAYAAKYIIQDSDVYLASELSGSKRITNNHDVKYLFGTTNDVLVLGKQKDAPVASSEKIGSTNLYLYRIDSGVEEKITDESVDTAFINKSNGKEVVFVTAGAEVKIYDIENKKVRKIVEKAINPNIDNAGKRVVYKKLSPQWQPGDYLDGSLGLFVTDLQTGEEKQLTSGEMDYAPLWSPDGKYVLFYSNNPDGLNSLYVVDANGNNLTQLSNLNEVFVSDKTVDSPSEPPIWSSDGRYIVYESDRRIWVNELDLKNKSLVSAKPISYGVSPEWVDDGKTISVVYTKANSKSASIVVIDLDGNIIKRK
jgi:hypothetical protein